MLIVHNRITARGQDYGTQPIALLYLAALSTVGASLVLLLRPLFGKTGVRLGVFFWFPLLSLLLTTTCVWISLSIIIFPVTDATTANALLTVYLVFDGFTSFFLGMAYWLRLRVVINSGMRSGALPETWLYRFVPNVLAIVPCIYWVVDVLGIVGIWVPSLGEQANGNFLQWNFGAGNIALATNDLVIHTLFVVMLLKQITVVYDRRAKQRLVAVSAVLSLNSCGLFIGAILSFFFFDIGSTIAGSFWLSNVLSFLLLNTSIRQTLRHRSSSTSRTQTTNETSK